MQTAKHGVESRLGRTPGAWLMCCLPPNPHAHFLAPPPGPLSEDGFASIFGVSHRTQRIALRPGILLVIHQLGSGYLRQKSHFLGP